MRYRYYIIDDDGDIYGSNDEAAAAEASEEWMVIDIHEGKCLGTKRHPALVTIPEWPSERR